jgi:hypothetical protein
VRNIGHLYLRKKTELLPQRHEGTKKWTRRTKMKSFVPQRHEDTKNKNEKLLPQRRKGTKKPGKEEM